MNASADLPGGESIKSQTDGPVNTEINDSARKVTALPKEEVKNTEGSNVEVPRTADASTSGRESTTVVKPVPGVVQQPEQKAPILSTEDIFNSEEDQQ
jgi:hypothetical protein